MVNKNKENRKDPILYLIFKNCYARAFFLGLKVTVIKIKHIKNNSDFMTVNVMITHNILLLLLL